MTRREFRLMFRPGHCRHRSGRCSCGRPLASAAAPRRRAAATRRRPRRRPLAVSRPLPVESRPIERYLRVTGSLMADEQAEVSAETAGRVIATPVERGTRVPAGALLVRISRIRDRRRSCRKPRPTPAQIEARLGLDARRSRSTQRGARSDERARRRSTGRRPSSPASSRSLDQKVVSQSEFDQRRTQVEAARQQYEVAKNGAEQPYQSLAGGARPRRARQQGAGRHVVRAPFAGLVAERARQRRRLRHQGHEGRDGRAHQSAARRADGARAVRVARSRSGSRSLRGRCLSGRGVRRPRSATSRRRCAPISAR